MGVVGSVMGGWSVMPAIVQQLLRTEVLRWPAGQSSGSMRSCARDAESVCLLVRKVHWRSSTGRCEWFPKSYVTDSAPAWENVLKGRSSWRSAPPRSSMKVPLRSVWRSCGWNQARGLRAPRQRRHWSLCCLLYTSDAADDLTRVDLGGRRI